MHVTNKARNCSKCWHSTAHMCTQTEINILIDKHEDLV